MMYTVVFKSVHKLTCLAKIMLHLLLVNVVDLCFKRHFHVECLLCHLVLKYYYMSCLDGLATATILKVRGLVGV